MKQLILLIFLSCALNPIALMGYGHGGAVAAGVGAGLFGLGLIGLAASKSHEPQVIYVQQQPQTVQTQEQEEMIDDTLDDEIDNEIEAQEPVEQKSKKTTHKLKELAPETQEVLYEQS